MAADNMRVTRSMAAAARDAPSSLEPETEVKHEEQVVGLTHIKNRAEVTLTALCVENEGAQWLFTNQTLFHYSDVPAYEEGSHVVSDQPAEDEGDVIVLRGDSRACEQVR